MNNKVSIKDIARIANVSVATVSNVINQTGRVSASTINKVNKVIQEQQFVLSASARNLKNKNSHLIAVVVPFLEKGILQDNPFYWELVRGVENGARHHEVQVILQGINEDEDFSFVKQRHLDGLIVVGAYGESSAYQKVLEMGVPCVFLDSYLSNPGLYQVNLDDEAGGYLGTKHLIGLGHKTIAVLTGRLEEGGVNYYRYQGYLRALQECGTPGDPELVFEEFSSIQGGYQAAQKIGSSKRKISAIFAFSDVSAMGLIRGLYDIGLSVPTDMSVVGFDDIFYTRYMIPSLTTIQQDVLGKAQTAVNMLLDQINGRVSSTRNVTIPVSLTVRQSTIPYSKKI
ncbi:LacI family DNA-binding transcriptional regulator [Paenibacillus ihuae]|uniref:LacI family DNA-binding transcriptional regulator n=1 Tax=Paenibacillus ihuae TaxID=1232431 RepID=UPI0006D52D1D|nr:LacI family DNA-binding transcriptional regulator [Paenibacillus ihuae]